MLGIGPRGLNVLGIQQSVYRRVAHDCLHVFACLAKGNGLYEFIDVPIWALFLPVFYPVGPGIVCRQRELYLPVEAVHYLLEVARAKLNIDVGVGQLLLAEVSHANFFCQFLADRWKQLH